MSRTSGAPRPAVGPALGRTPYLLLVPAVLAVGFLVVPLSALLVRTPWGDLGGHLVDPAVLEALRLSLLTSLAAVVVVVLVGIPLAWVLARVDFPGRTLVRALVVVPLVLDTDRHFSATAEMSVPSSSSPTGIVEPIQ